MLGELNLYGGTLALPVPGFHSIDVSTVPLMVVEESAVNTELGFSSALTADAKLTTPRAASATVHLLNFIRSSDMIVSILAYLMHCRGKNGLPPHQNRCIYVNT